VYHPDNWFVKIEEVHFTFYINGRIIVEEKNLQTTNAK